MTDYHKTTGSSGNMMIRDTGSTVEFWLYAASATFDHQMPWRYYFNGAWSTYRNFDFAGGAYRKLGAVTVTTDQTVGFEIGATGTAGLGGPTAFTVAIDRTSAPGTPGAWTIKQISDTGIYGGTDSMPNGGLSIDQIQVRYDDNSAASTPSYASDNDFDGDFWINGLPRGTKFYFWVRTHNAKGWSPWSAMTSATTHDFPPAPTTPVISEITQNSLRAQFSGNGDGGSGVLEWQLAYDTVNPPVAAAGSNGVSYLTGLVPGATYYFRARGRNTYGWGAWSGISSAQLKAGAYVDYPVNGVVVKKRAVPYVNVNGVWKVAQPMVNLKGLWKPTE